MRWLAGLSGRQHVWLVLVSAVGLLIVVVGVVRQQSTVEAPLAAVTVGMTVQQIAPQLDVTGRSLARELGLPLDTPKNTPVKTLGVTEEQLGHVVHHLLGRRESTLKY